MFADILRWLAALMIAAALEYARRRIVRLEKDLAELYGIVRRDLRTRGRSS